MSVNSNRSQSTGVINQRRRRPPQTTPNSEQTHQDGLLTGFLKPTRKHSQGLRKDPQGISGPLASIYDLVQFVEKQTEGSHRRVEFMEDGNVVYSKPPHRPAVGCVGSITWQGGLQSPAIRRSSSMMKVNVKRPPSVDSSSASTADSDGNDDTKVPSTYNSNSSLDDPDSGSNSRPASRGGSSCGSLDLPYSCAIQHWTNGSDCEEQEGSAWELDQFKEGKASLAAETRHLSSDDPARRRSAIEEMAKASEDATMKSTEAVIECLADSDKLVRRSSVQALASVLSLAKDSKVAELAQRTLACADPCLRFDAVEALLPFAMKGKKGTRAFNAMDEYRLHDKDPSIRLKAERSLLVVAGRKRQNIVRCSRAGIEHANEACNR